MNKKMLTATGYNDFYDILSAIEYKGEFVIETLNINNLYLKTNSKGMKYFSYILNGTEFPIVTTPMFLDRIGVGASVFYDTSMFNKMSEDIFNIVQTLLIDKTIKVKFYIFDNCIRAVHSKDYKELSLTTLFSSLYFHLKDKCVGFSDAHVVFEQGVYSDDITTARFSITGNSILQQYSQIIGRNRKISDIRLSIIFNTSHVGMSGANLYPYIQYKTTDDNWLSLPLYKGRISLEHKGTASIKSFCNNVDSVFTTIEKNIQNLKDLENVEIQNPVACALNVAERVGLSKKKVFNAIDIIQSLAILQETITAQDIYLYLSAAIIEQQSTNCENIKKNIDESEKVGRIIKLLLDKDSDVDIPLTKWKFVEKKSEPSHQLHFETREVA